MHRVWRVINAGHFYPNPSPMNSPPVRTASPAGAGPDDTHAFHVSRRLHDISLKGAPRGNSNLDSVHRCGLFLHIPHRQESRQPERVRSRPPISALPVTALTCQRERIASELDHNEAGPLLRPGLWFAFSYHRSTNPVRGDSLRMEREFPSRQKIVTIAK